MGRFKQGLEVSSEVPPVEEAIGQPKAEPKPKKQKQQKFSEADMQFVNVGGFKVPRIVREHWVAGAARNRTPISQLLRSLLLNEFGLPDGITEEDLKPPIKGAKR